ncbi:unnamed protein product [Echinostoma caproni]|uniref:Reverse transcriptase domain-containing protein n=1 Tax=Echinostoma caproni TaxID=27848 RepID=A0A3P8I9K0_9TREM|nr:unnamed protein product [Echinostoma caproni]
MNSVRNFTNTTSTITTNWRRAIEIPSIEQLNLQVSPSEIEEWVEQFELWCSIRKGGVQKQSALFLTAGGRDQYSLLRNLAFPGVPAKLPYESLKSLLLNHLLPSEFQAHECAKFNSVIRTDHKFIVDAGSMESIISNAVPRSICPEAKIQPTSMRILGAAIDEVIHGVLAYQDDAIVFGAKKVEHDERLTNLLERFAQKNVSICASKCMFNSPELEFLGFTIDEKRLPP